MASQFFRVRLTASAKDDLRRIGKRYGKKSYETIRDLICDLEFDPDRKGEPLQGRLSGFYSRHYSRFRIIYKIDKGEPVVVVVGTGYHEAGSRTDIYKLIERLVDSGTLIIQEKGSESTADSTEDD